MSKWKLIGLVAVVVAVAGPNMTVHAAIKGGTGSADQIIATARAHLTASGRAWAAGEGQRLRSGDIDPMQVEKDVGAVPNGTVSEGVPDELVLIALVDARSAGGGSAREALANMDGAPPVENRPGRTSKAKLEQTINNVVQTLTDTQRRPGPPR
jgi:hypothetical protein